MVTELKPIIPSQMNPPLNTRLITDVAGLQSLREFIDSVDAYVFDVETNVCEHFQDQKIRTIQIGNRNQQFVIDLLAFAGSTEALIASQGNFGAAAQLCFAPILDVIRPSLESNKWLKIGTFLKFDYEMMFWNLGVRMWHLYDNLLAEKNIFAGLVHFMATGYWGLEDMVGRYCGLLLKKDEQKGFKLEGELTESQIIYAGLDARLPAAIRQGQIIKLERDGLMAAAQIDFDAIPAFGDMHLFGFYLDCDAWMAVHARTKKSCELLLKALDSKFIPVTGSKFVTDADRELLSQLEKDWNTTPQKTVEDKALRATRRVKFVATRSKINAKTKEANRCDGEAFLNYSSTKQMKVALLKLGFKEKQLPNTKDLTLEKLAKYKAADFDIDDALEIDSTLMSLPVIDLIRLYRSASKALTTYGRVWVESGAFEDEDDLDKQGRPKKKSGNINPYSGRIHSDIDLFGAVTGRSTSSDPNIQNIPRATKYRICFKAGKGKKLITIDMSGAELRILAELSLEPVWVEAFKNGWDVHSIGAQIVFGKEWDDGTEEGCAFVTKYEKCKCKVHKRLRQIAKTINFMLAYGGGPQKLADEVQITFDEADVIINDKYKPKFPVVVAFLLKLGQQAATDLEVRTMVGRRRRWPRVEWETAKAALLKEWKKDKKPGSPTGDDIRYKMRRMAGAIMREGMNAPIQGTNGDFIKKAMGCGFDPEGKPYLWHILWPTYQAMMVSMVHDELITEVEEEKAQTVKGVIDGAICRAAGEYMKTIVMETEGGFADAWSK